MRISLAFKKSAKSLWKATPLIIGTVLLVSLIATAVPKKFFSHMFTGNFLLDPLIGSLIGSVSAGNPITCYIIGGELLKHGITLLAVTSFLVAWVTVGIVQLPAESAILGKKFAIFRNLIAFFLSIIVALFTIIFLEAI